MELKIVSCCSRKYKQQWVICLNKYYIEYVSIPFFLTRQTANLMEDFVRELEAGVSVFLLYGESSVGKTRLLEELTRTRLADSRVHWINLKVGGKGDGSLADASAIIEDVFANAQQGDLIIADHFEVALQKTRHQLFSSWSTDGVDKQVNLIIISNNSFFDEFKQLAQRYHVTVQAFELMSLSPEEVAAFLGYYLFPDRPIGKLSIPMVLQDQLTMTKGAVGKIIEIAERAGDQIRSIPLEEPEAIPKESKNHIGVFIGLALVVGIGIGWYFLSSQPQIFEAPDADIEIVAAPEVTARVEAATADESASQSAIPPPSADEGESAASVASEVADDAVTSTEVAVVDTVVVEETVGVEEPAEEPLEEEEDALAFETDTATGTGEEARLVDETVAPGSDQSTGTAADQAPTQPASAKTEMASTPVPGPVPASGASRLDSDLQTSLDWINRSESKVGTIQIMTLSRDKFNLRTYYDYIDYLAKRGVDISALKVFLTHTAGQEVYSVFYGEYESWQAASDAIDGLSEVLRDTSPIPRSAGGIMEEIQRLEAEN